MLRHKGSIYEIIKINKAANNYLPYKDKAEKWCLEHGIKSHSCVCCNLSFSILCFGSWAARAC